MCKKFPEALNWAKVFLDQIIFVENTTDEPQSNGDTKRAGIVKIPARFRSLLRQFTGHHFEYVIEVYRINCLGMTPAKLTALLYHQLRHIGAEGEIIPHHVQDFSEIVQAFGGHWFYLDIPDLLAPGVTWENAIARTLFPEPDQSKVAHEGALEKQA